MALETKTKQPSEELLFDMDFRKVQPAGVTVASVVSVDQSTVTGTGTVAIGSTAYSGTLAQVWISGGTDDEDYKITITITNSRGETVEGDGLLQVRDL